MDIGESISRLHQIYVHNKTVTFRHSIKPTNYSKCKTHHNDNNSNTASVYRAFVLFKVHFENSIPLFNILNKIVEHKDIDVSLNGNNPRKS